mmetsp:Transcript_48151/g.127498  ORF Transcript_48151/g.127498 Transcript_48151/m.127498 type:complete len:234 (+) Transcript_48151:2711-3412(+)
MAPLFNSSTADATELTVSLSSTFAPRAKNDSYSASDPTRKVCVNDHRSSSAGCEGESRTASSSLCASSCGLELPTSTRRPSGVRLVWRGVEELQVLVCLDRRVAKEVALPVSVLPVDTLPKCPEILARSPPLTTFSRKASHAAASEAPVGELNERPTEADGRMVLESVDNPVANAGPLDPPRPVVARSTEALVAPPMLELPKTRCVEACGDGGDQAGADWAGSDCLLCTGALP